MRMPRVRSNKFISQADVIEKLIMIRSFCQALPKRKVASGYSCVFLLFFVCVYCPSLCTPQLIWRKRIPENNQKKASVRSIH